MCLPPSSPYEYSPRTNILGWRPSLVSLEAIAIGLEAIAGRLEAIASSLEAIAISLVR